MLAIVKKNTNNYIEISPYYDGDILVVIMDEHDYKKEIIKSNISKLTETEKKTCVFVNILIENITNIKRKHPSFYEDYLLIVQEHIDSYFEVETTDNSKADIILHYVDETKRRFKNEEILFHIKLYSATIIDQYLKIILNKRDYALYRKTKPVEIKAHFDRSTEYKIEYRNMLKEHFYKFVENY